MTSFRLAEEDLAAAQEWADRLGLDRSELLRQALHSHLVRLRAEADAQAWVDKPLTQDERALHEIAYWGPAEDWSDWADATG